MVKAIDAAIDRIRQLPETEQELLARFVLHEIDQDGAWRQTSELHTESLARLVDIISAEDARGECPDLDVGDL
jgi:hypothetical protein